MSGINVRVYVHLSKIYDFEHAKDNKHTKRIKVIFYVQEFPNETFRNNKQILCYHSY